MKFASPAASRVSRLALPLLLLAAVVTAKAQDKPSDKPTGGATTTNAASNTPATAAPVASAAATKTSAVTATMSPTELARAAYAAQGGDKFRDLKNMVLLGTVDLFSPNSTQSLSGKFGMVMEGVKVRQDVQSPIISFQLIYDGERNYSSLRGMSLPPPSKYGLPVLAKFDQPGYAVTALPDKKKERAFRITDAEGNVTDYYVEVATGRVIRYEIPYNGMTVSVEHKTLKDYEGVLIPTNFVQKLAAPQGDFYAEFKVKDVKLNQQLPADTFNIPAQ
ncbi:MAG TPA: hypothetical protein VJT82_08345 [Pyrinomonadaceae bacterium]|nr:hypothetical protein [Pyrinomonadaceae bacterium]